MSNAEESPAGPKPVVRRTPWQPSNPLETAPIHAANQPHGTLPNTPLAVSLIAFLLGGVFFTSFAWFIYAAQREWPSYRPAFFIASWACFHYAEFAVTAGWNRDKVSVDSFLLNNGIHYHVAHTLAITEYLITMKFFPTFKTFPYITPIGIVVTVISHFVRSGAMITAARSFSHTVMFKKVDQHVLVTHGLYGWLRHPSYFGFFYWGLGTQMVLQNPFSFVGYALVMWRFFNSRIKVEEVQLVKFFGNDYVNYRTRVGTGIPFIR